MNVIDSATQAKAERVLSVDDPKVSEMLRFIETGAAQRDQQHIHPFEAIELIRRSGLGALRVPQEAGGIGASLRDSFRFVLALSTADANVAHILRNHYSFVEKFARASSDGSHEHWARVITDGGLVGLGSTEPNKSFAGRGGTTATLVPDGDRFILNTRKIYTTGLYYADYAEVRVITQDGRPASAIIPTDREGVLRHDDWDGFGQRLTGSGTTDFTNVEVFPYEIVFEDRSNTKQNYSSTHPQLFLTAVVAGVIRAVSIDGTAELRRRSRNFAHAPHSEPTEDVTLQQILGEIISAAVVAESAVLSAADALERSLEARESGLDNFDLAHEASRQAAAVKVIIDDLAFRASTRLLDLGGASSTVAKLGLDRHWRNARTIASHNPASYKAIAIGKYALSGEQLPNAAFF